MVAYNRQTSVLRGTADTQLCAASYGSARWVLLSPAPAADVARALRTRLPSTLSLSLPVVGGSSQLPALGKEVNLDNKRFVSHGFCHCAAAHAGPGSLPGPRTMAKQMMIPNVDTMKTMA